MILRGVDKYSNQDESENEGDNKGSSECTNEDAYLCDEVITSYLC